MQETLFTLGLAALISFILFNTLKNHPQLMFFFSIFTNILSILAILKIAYPNTPLNKLTIR